MAARDEILSALRAAAVPEAPLPDVSLFAAVRFPDLRDRFAKSVVEVGGRCVALAEGDSLEAALQAVPEYAAARKVASLVPGVAKANVDVAATRNPHDLRDVDFCVVSAELGVAENGACWIVHHGGANRAVLFLTQHLAVVVRGETLVHNLHEGYARAAIPAPGFALWLSGPSKTADIEQSLVIGAHGARSCTVFVVG
ncbi:MAG TPA: LUD domain-containing protein [Myxococcales bacterium]|nr:LUD domain-containing protein [Myxococcales bacterium]